MFRRKISAQAKKQDKKEQNQEKWNQEKQKENRMEEPSKRIAEICMANASSVGDRTYQQDTSLLFQDEKKIIAVLCDGMGGLESGELASQTAAKLFLEDMQRRWKGEEYQTLLRKEAHKINEQIILLKNKSGEYLSAGTTLVAVVIEKERLYWMSIGDSSIYLIRDNKISKLTREHNYRLVMDQYIKKGYINREEYKEEEESAEKLVSYIGIDKLEIIDVCPIAVELQIDDKILLCSDGLYRAMTEEQILAVLQESQGSTAYAASNLIQYATHLVKGNQDNTTVIVIEVK